MGPRKRSKPNPEAETGPASEEAALPRGTKLQAKDSLSPAVGHSLPSDKPIDGEPVSSSINGTKTVSAEDGQVV